MTDILTLFKRLNDWQSILDIGLVTLVFYLLLRLFQGTQAMQLLRGILIIGLGIAAVTNFVNLTAFSWLARTSSLAVLVAVPVIFQPELRRALERVGRSNFFFARRNGGAATQQLITEIVRAMEQMSNRRHGALIVVEGDSGLGEYVDRGVAIDAEVTSELLQTLFFPNTALHDGAVIIQRQRIMAAGCVLPLTQRELKDSQLGTRHRAAIGITEQTDALTLVVSEETGTMSVARNGRIVRRLDVNRLRRILTEFYGPAQADGEGAKSAKSAEDDVNDEGAERILDPEDVLARPDDDSPINSAQL
ncbi:MAG: diadenylate cyclase CdaA [Caldilineaceae bacterium]|nr:diadenylate cyclase CdaA [Caldilineaceae bacterium]MBP8106684.1 diadenylate cyclase CdaA [Caldilineaceae bacterium]MBP8122176.1 diadenylate cyclase CdaA [Caldilineaceae bacterium]MBP9071735.1 diadenylate cyclase CdaA [Caldilineaceae bacterium]